VVVLLGGCKYTAPEPSDTAPDGSSCTPISKGLGRLAAPTVDPPILDGVFDDWTTCFVALDTTNAGLVRELEEARFASGAFSVAHDGSRLFVAVRLTAEQPRGNELSDIYRNDSIAIYVDADRVSNTDYDGNAAQIVIDHAARIRSFRKTVPITLPGVDAVVQEAATIDFEVAISQSALGPFASTVGFDLGLSEGDGQDQLSEVVWHQECDGQSGCLCSNDDDAPYCNAKQFGAVELLP